MLLKPETNMPEKKMEMKSFANREEWRKWLDDNYKKENEIGLVYYKKGSGTDSVTYDESVEEALCFGWIDGVRKSIDDKRYFIRFTPRKPGSVWSLVNTQRIEQLTVAGKMKPEGLKVVEEAKQSGEWQKAYSLKAGREIPADFQEALDKNDAAKAYFEKLSNSDKSAYISHASLKTPDKRAERIKKIIELLERNIKPHTGQKPSHTVY
jgi:uncharacterized protein YdeI (YjbR/CyaY-like superfamily)